MRAFARRHPIVCFVILAYGLSWAAWAPLLVRGALVTPGGSVTHFPGLLGPAAAAFLVTALTDGTAGLRRLLARLVLVSRPAGGFALYSCAPAGFLALALAVVALTGRSVPTARDFATFSGLPVLPLGIVVVLVLLFNGVGEETGWRGFALERLQRRFGPLGGAVALGLVWAGWHVPSFWCIEGYRAMGPGTLIFGFGLGIVCGSIVLARVANRTQGSVLAAALWHLFYNFGAATAAARGVIGAVTTTCVMVWAFVLVVQELRRGGRPSLLLAVPLATAGEGR